MQFTTSSLLTTLYLLLLLPTSIRSVPIPNFDLSSDTLYPTKTIFTLAGSPSSIRAGNSVSTAGDIDGDGYSDVIIGAYLYGDNNEGAAYVLYGGLESSFQDVTGATTLDPATAGFAIIGAAGDIFGYSVSTAGDLDNDGYDDIIIGAYAQSDSRGAAYVIYGGERSSLQNINLGVMDLKSLGLGFKMTGDASKDTFGWSVSTAGNINNDDYADIIIGARGQSTTPGAVYVIYGGPRSSLLDRDFSSFTLTS